MSETKNEPKYYNSFKKITSKKFKYNLLSKIYFYIKYYEWNKLQDNHKDWFKKVKIIV